MDSFTAGFFRLFTEKRQNLAFERAARYSPSNPSISQIFLKFPKFLNLKSLGNSCGNSYIHSVVIII